MRISASSHSLLNASPSSLAQLWLNTFSSVSLHLTLASLPIHITITEDASQHPLHVALTLKTAEVDGSANLLSQTLQQLKLHSSLRLLLDDSETLHSPLLPAILVAHALFSESPPPPRFIPSSPSRLSSFSSRAQTDPLRKSQQTATATERGASEGASAELCLLFGSVTNSALFLHRYRCGRDSGPLEERGQRTPDFCQSPPTALLSPVW